MNLSEWLKVARTVRKWSLRDLEKISGLNNAHLCQIENGHINLTLKNAEVLANSFDLKLWELLRDLDI